MNTRYTLSDGSKLETFMWSDLLQNETFRKVIDVTHIKDGKRGKEVKRKIYKDEQGVYFMWGGERIYLANFDHMPLEELIDNIRMCVEKKDRWYVDNDEIYATFMKETERLGIVIDMPLYEILLPRVGFAIVGDKHLKALCIPTESRYPKNNWSYALTLECECEELRTQIASRIVYFSDLCQLLKTGQASLVLKDDYKAQMTEQYEARAKEERKFRNRLAKLLGIQEEKEPLVLIGWKGK